MSAASTQMQSGPSPCPSPQWSRVTALSGSPVWLTDARRAIAHLVDLPIGWDGNASPAIQQSAIDSAWRVLSELERYDELPSPYVGPTVGGGLGIEWHCGSRELDLEILPDGSIEYLKTHAVPTDLGVGQMDDGQLPLNRLGEGVRRLASWLMIGI
jgi:hypothetical protein